MTTNAAENATAGVPVVRGLDWLRQTDGILSRAETELGTYRVWTFAGARRWHWELSRGYQRFSGSAADEDLALAAAQADFEQRILSALTPDFLSELDTARAEIERLRGLADRLTLEAQAHASEARTANSTIYEIYQVLSGSTGEPGNWNGAEPARQFVTAAQARIAELEERLGTLLKLNDEHAPFGGEMYRDRVDRAWSAARATLSTAVKESK